MAKTLLISPLQVLIHRQHVLRAWKLLLILHKMRDFWSKDEEDGTEKVKVKPPPADLLAQKPDHAMLPPGLVPFPATQPEVDKPELPDESTEAPAPVPKQCLQGKAFEKKMQEGFNNGTTVQCPSSFMSDREVFRKTLLRGKSEVTFHDLSLRKVETQDNGSKKKLSVSKENWEQVMAKGFALWPVGKLVQPGTKHCKAIFTSVPDTPNKRVYYHNMLVDSCQLTLRQFTDVLSKNHSKKRKNPSPDFSDPKD